MKKLGILGGISFTSTIEYYKKIMNLYYEKFQDYYYPEIVIRKGCLYTNGKYRGFSCKTGTVPVHEEAAFNGDPIYNESFIL